MTVPTPSTSIKVSAAYTDDFLLRPSSVILSRVLQICLGDAESRIKLSRKGYISPAVPKPAGTSTGTPIAKVEAGESSLAEVLQHIIGIVELSSYRVSEPSR